MVPAEGGYLSEIVRFSRLDQVAYGIRVGVAIFELVGDVFGEFKPGSAIAQPEQVKLLPPCQPTKIVGFARNYRHLSEPIGNKVSSDPITFLKSPSAVIGPADPIVLPEIAGEVYFEAELAVVIKRRMEHVSPSAVQNYILGYTCANDVTARSAFDLRNPGAQGKNFDTFCPLGPSLVTGLDVSDLMICTRVNGQLRQESSTKDMILSVPLLVSHVSRVMTLEPGDVILTGTPPGPDIIRPGDLIEVEIEGIGTLANRAITESTFR